jgi:hypothetical protein
MGHLERQKPTSTAYFVLHEVKTRPKTTKLSLAARKMAPLAHWVGSILARQSTPIRLS